MTDSKTLVDRLRAEKEYRVVDFTPVSTTKPLCAEAADRIEELEAALKRIADFGQANPGHGRSCAVIALRALVGDEHD